MKTTARRPLASPPLFAFDNSYARDLADTGVAWTPDTPPAPRLTKLNHPLAEELGLDAQRLAGEEGLAALSGASLPAGAQPIAQAYAGHQFGQFSPRLGDGRALLLGEIIDRRGARRDIAVKGSGRTPFSRGGDGKAALAPMLREYLISEAMHALGIPTTRTLAVVATGERVVREHALPGALLTRVAASHLRVGTFEYFAARGEHAALKRLADYTLARHDHQLLGTPDAYLHLLEAVCDRQAALIARWMGVGFIHGVMNTDNMTISGETIDYGPCAFMDAYDPQTAFSSIDTRGRYAYGNQPGIAQWNLTRFAEALLPLILARDEHDTPTEAELDAALAPVRAVLDRFPERYAAYWQAELRRKLDLDSASAQTDTEAADRLSQDFLALLQAHRVDFTLAFHHLAEAAQGQEAPFLALFPRGAAAPSTWLAHWQTCVHAQASGARAARLARANPRYIPRNHLVEEALAAASDTGDLAPFERLLATVQRPYAARATAPPGNSPAADPYAQPASAKDYAAYRTFCGT